MWSRWGEVPAGTFRSRTPVGVVDHGPTSHALFAVGEDGRAYASMLADDWPPTDWLEVADGGRFAQGTPIAAVSDRVNAIDAFAVDELGDVVTAWLRDGSWQGWRPVLDAGLLPGTPVAAISDRRDWIDLFVVGDDGRVRTAWFHAAPWQGWQPVLDRTFPQRTPIVAVSDGPGWIDLFAVGHDGLVHTAWFHAAPWQGWQPVLDMRFPAGTPIAAVSDRPGWIDLFAVGHDGFVHTAWFHGAGWQGWARVAEGESPLDPGTIDASTFAPGTGVAAFRPLDGVGVSALAENGHVYVAEWRPDRPPMPTMPSMQSTPTTPPPVPPRGQLQFILSTAADPSDDWHAWVTPDPARMYVIAAPPGVALAQAPRHALTQGALGWTTAVPAAAGPAGVWTFQCHIGGVFAQGAPASIPSPVYAVTWDAGSPAAYLHCGSNGSGQFPLNAWIETTVG